MEDEKLDLVIFVQSNSYGGTERHTLDLVDHIDREGLRAAFVYCGEGFNGHIPEELSYVEVTKASSTIQNLNIKGIRVWPKVFKRFKSQKALLIKPSYFSVDLKFLLLLRFYYEDLIVIEHSLPPKRLPIPRVGFIPKIGYWRLKSESLRYFFSSLVDTVIAVSEVARMELDKHTYYKDIKVCSNGINSDLWVHDTKKGKEFRVTNGIDSGLHLFGCVGNLFTVKSFDVAIQALSLVKDRYRTKCALCIIGLGPEQNNLKSLAEKLSLDNVFFVGKQFDMVSAYSAMQTLLITSKSESASLVLLEASACGCDVLSSDVGYSSEVIKEMNNGYIVGSYNPQVWARAIENYLDKKKHEDHNLSPTRKSKFVEKYDINKRMSNLLETIMANN
ncbi:glycosyltransferase family 4 protein [Marinobacter maritimus]|uniref:glycosyltransferase family 4 protein n=1 Tax=Marinobacter maritimus TaxID=277961 RepID=UPI0011A58A37|nr:glycosyltransferase [Marinobacter maritimus]|tara:strand:+ start:768 stop:1934 length:1167 start_codon:yes stop_codon:yes gene_type:complete